MRVSRVVEKIYRLTGAETYRFLYVHFVMIAIKKGRYWSVVFTIIIGVVITLQDS